MNEFTKLKIGFALALLGAVFAVTPIVTPYLSIGYTLFGFKISIKWAFLALSILLGVSVYFYALTLLSSKSQFELARNAGHWIYALALLVPPFYIALYLVSLLSLLVDRVLKAPGFTRGLEILLSAVAGIVANILSAFIFRIFRNRDKAEKVEQLAHTENRVLSRAKSLFDDGYYEMVVIEVWRAIEASISRALMISGYTRKPPVGIRAIEYAKSNGILRESLFEQLDFVRILRNKSAHTDYKVTMDEAQRVLTISDKVISTLRYETETCYYCNKELPKQKMHVDDMETYYVCEDCAKKHPDWKEEIFAMGMDP